MELNHYKVFLDAIFSNLLVISELFTQLGSLWAFYMQNRFVRIGYYTIFKGADMYNSLIFINIYSIHVV